MNSVPPSGGYPGHPSSPGQPPNPAEGQWINPHGGPQPPSGWNQPYPPEPYPGQPQAGAYPGQPYPGQPYPPHPYPGQPYPPYGAAPPPLPSTAGLPPGRWPPGFNPVAAGLAKPPETPGQIWFVGKDWDFVRLLLRGYLLGLVTLGIYRFWMITDVRRFLWSHVRALGETLEYTGTGKELLLGFLVAIAVLVPIYTLLFIGSLYAGPWAVLASVAGFFFLMVFGQFALYRARRYRLTRTLYRGVRPGQSGSGFVFAAMSLAWAIPLILSFGLILPWMHASLERYKMRHTSYGDLRGDFTGTGAQLFKSGAWLWALAVLPLAIAVIAFIVVAAGDFGNLFKGLGEINLETDFEDDFKVLTTALGERPGPLIAMAIAAGWAVAVGFLAFPAYQAIVYRWWAEGVRLGPIAARSWLKTSSFYGAWVRFIGVTTLFGFALSFVSVITVAVASGMAENIQKAFQGEVTPLTVLVIAMVGLLYIVTLLGYAVIYRATVEFRYWKHMWESMELSNLAALDAVQARAVSGNALGEGLADALDIGAF